MHLLSTKPGGYVEDGGQGIVRVEQTPGDIVVLSAADTVLSVLAEAATSLPENYGVPFGYFLSDRRALEKRENESQ